MAFRNKASQHVTKNLQFFQRHEAALKGQRLNFTENSQQKNAAIIRTSYKVALELPCRKNRDSFTQFFGYNISASECTTAFVHNWLVSVVLKRYFAIKDRNSPR